MRVGRRRRYLSDEERVAIVESYRSGVSTYKLGAEYGINRQTVSAVVKHFGYRTRYRLLTSVDVAHAKARYLTGESPPPPGRSEPS